MGKWGSKSGRFFYLVCLEMNKKFHILDDMGLKGAEQTQQRNQNNVELFVDFYTYK